METFHTFVDYVLFTKYMEYALAFGFMALFLAFYIFLRPAPAREKALAARMEPAAVGARVQGFEVPDGVFFHQGHAWAKADDFGAITVGLDDFARRLLGRIDNVKLPELGTWVNQGTKSWSLDVDSESVDMLSPVDGKVIEINKEIVKSPDKVSSDPYGQGWLFKVRSPNPAANFKNLIKGKLAKLWTEEVVQALTAKTNQELGLMAADGAMPADGMAKRLDPNNWVEICKDCFLTD